MDTNEEKLGQSLTMYIAAILLLELVINIMGRTLEVIYELNYEVLNSTSVRHQGQNRLIVLSNRKCNPQIQHRSLKVSNGGRL